MAGNGMQGRNWVLAAMIFAVSMTFIDQTIVSIAVPNIQRELHLSSTGVQWVVNGYLIALSALFALGGRLSDIFGHRKLCVIGVIVFVVASTMCGLTPTGSAAEAWIVSFRVIQGAGGALMFPAALAIVVEHLPPARAGQGSGPLLRHRGRAHRHRAASRRLPDRVDLARHLLGQHPGRPRRTRSHCGLQAQDAVQACAHRLPRRGVDRGRDRPEHLRSPAVGPLGLEQPSYVDLHCGGAGHHRPVRVGRAAHGVTVDQGLDLQDSGLHGRERRPVDRR